MPPTSQPWPPERETRILRVGDAENMSPTLKRIEFFHAGAERFEGEAS